MISLLTIAFIREPLPAVSTEKRRHLLSDVTEGIAFILRDPFLRALAMIEPLINAAFTGATFCVIVVLRTHGWSSGIIGLILAGISVAGVLGAVIAPWLQRLARPSNLVIGVSWCLAAALVLAAPVVNSPLVVIPLAVPMLLAASVNAALVAHQLAITPDRLQGRVVNAILLVASILELPAPAVVGALLEHVSGTVVMLVFGGLVIISAVIASLHSGIRQMRSLDDRSLDKPA
jgi:predicted MFS family arabinose efflux permease